jgi:hypothetical protein
MSGKPLAKPVRITPELPKDLVMELREYCLKEGRFLAAVVGSALREYLDKVYRETAKRSKRTASSGN